ncbi:hypothetical protein B0H10DRAFT_2213707 [Mycena sp. CBHHK59/15]|nr:hypothetical protein B0H10DRAFT_2213707 [Mycena sp. CBHHK59/15]
MWPSPEWDEPPTQGNYVKGPEMSVGVSSGTADANVSGHSTSVSSAQGVLQSANVDTQSVDEEWLREGGVGGGATQSDCGGVEGMSSEEEDCTAVGEAIIRTYIIKISVWRAPEIADYMRIVDKAAERMRINKGANPAPRCVTGLEGKAPKGLPECMYNPECGDLFVETVCESGSGGLVGDSEDVRAKDGARLLGGLALWSR